MYENLGFHWAASTPAFLSLACLPFPFLLYKFGARIRASCKYATEADRITTVLMSQMAETVEKEDSEKQEGSISDKAPKGNTKQPEGRR